ncbi:MAG: methyltransferase domain-containing protein [Acidobacteria bacterium]|jgi:SAM-dependent methyltransferase|nr:methyltransferase domain-containing protein [Acidobacteriota bacterium]
MRIGPPLCSVILALGVGTVDDPAESPRRGRELTIRNATREEVSFQLTRVAADHPEAESVLQAGAVVRFPGSVFDIAFESAGRRLEYRLDPGGDYAFRYDGRQQVDLFLGSHGREDVPDLAPYVATPMSVVGRMLELAGVGPEDVVFDLGCGDGRIVVAAAERYGARGVGVDLDPRRIHEARRLAKTAGVEPLVEFRVEDATATDFSRATVLTLYLLPESNELLRPIMERRLASGARVISHEYEIPGWTPLHEEAVLEDGGAEHYLYMYVMGRHEKTGPHDGATPRR